MYKLFTRKLVLTLSLISLFVSVPLASNQASAPPVRYRFFIKAKNRTDVRRLSGWLNQNSFDVAGVDLKKGTIEVLTTESGLKILRSQGLDGSLVKVPVIWGSSKSMGGLDDRYLTPTKVAQRLADLHARFPSVTRVIEIGRSLNNLPILGLVISTTLDLDDPRFHEKPTVLVDGMHHAREIMTPEVVLDIGDTLLGAAKSVARARLIVEGMNVVLVPMLNVDGNTRVWNNDTMWRKNAHAEENGSVFGVDINRNYPYRWSGCKGSSDRKGAQDYHGESAASEPETKALIAIAEKVRPMASLSYHSYSELVLYPYGCNGDLTGENQLLETLGKKMASLLPSDSGRGTYTPGTPWQILYGVDGDSMGYMFSAFGAVAYTFEVNQAFQPSYDLREPTLKKHRVAWAYFFDTIQKQLATFQVRDSAGRPVAATLEITQIPHAKGERDFVTNLAGNYFKVLLPGQYTVRAQTKSGRVAELQFVMGEGPQTLNLDVK
jgi:carboxypeptidase T